MTHADVMAGLVPAIHDLLPESKAWMPGPRPGMTVEMWCHQFEPAPVIAYNFAFS
jgi:hypothetical protein